MTDAVFTIFSMGVVSDVATEVSGVGAGERDSDIQSLTIVLKK